VIREKSNVLFQTRGKKNMIHNHLTTNLASRGAQASSPQMNSRITGQNDKSKGSLSPERANTTANALVKDRKEFNFDHGVTQEKSMSDNTAKEFLTRNDLQKLNPQRTQENAQKNAQKNEGSEEIVKLARIVMILNAIQTLISALIGKNKSPTEKNNAMPNQAASTPMAQRPPEQGSNEGLPLEGMHTTKPNVTGPMGGEEKVECGAWFHGSGAKATGMDHMFHLDENGKAPNKYFHFTKGSISGMDGAPNVNLSGSKNDDGKAMSKLFNSTDEASHLTEEQKIGLRRRMTQSNGDKTIDASDTMDQVKQIGEKYGKGSKEMSNYLQKIGAEPQDPARKAQIDQENLDPNKKFNGIKGLNQNVDLSVFESYEVRGKKPDGSEAVFKVSAEQAATAEYQQGRLQGAVDAHGKRMDFSNLTDVTIKGKLRMADDEDGGGKLREATVTVNDLNKIYSSEDKKAAWGEHRPEKPKSFWQKLGDFGLKFVKSFVDPFINFGKGLGKVFKGDMSGFLDMGKGLVDGVLTYGTGGALGVAKGVVKAGIGTALKTGGKEVAESGAKQVGKEVGESAAKNTGKNAANEPAKKWGQKALDLTGMPQKAHLAKTDPKTLAKNTAEETAFSQSGKAATQAGYDEAYEKLGYSESEKPVQKTPSNSFSYS
jgi:hypothetical protein